MKKNKNSSYEMKKSAVMAAMKGTSIKSLSEIYSKDRSTIHRWIQNFNLRKKITDLVPKNRTGRPAKSNLINYQQLKRDLLKSATNFGFETSFWNSTRIRQHLKKSYKVSISKATMCRNLRLAKITYRKPERRYYETDEKAQQYWLKNDLPEIIKFAKKQKAIIYFEDESCIRLTPIIGKTWTPKNKKVKHKVTGNRGSIAAMSAISSTGRLLFTLHKKTITAVEVILFLKQMLDHHPRRHLVVVMDQAKPHTANDVKTFIEAQKRLHVFYLPSRSPNLNPDEKVWRHLKHEELKSHGALTVRALQTLTNKKLKKMARNPDLVRGIFHQCEEASKFISK